MLKGKESVIFSLDYLTSIHHGLLSKKRIDREKQSSDFDEIAFVKKCFTVVTL